MQSYSYNNSFTFITSYIFSIKQKRIIKSYILFLGKEYEALFNKFSNSFSLNSNDKANNIIVSLLGW